MTRARPALALALLVATVGTARPAAASPLVDPTIGGMVFTGPASAHVSALYWNPAATGLMRGGHVFISGQLYDDYYQVQRSPIDTSTGEPTSMASAQRKEFAPAKGTLFAQGGFLGATWDAGGDTLAIAVGVYLPPGDVQPSGQDQLRYHTQGGNLQTATATLAVSYRLDSDWIMGAGLSGSLSWTHLHFAFDQALETCDGTKPCMVENPDTTSEFDISASTHGRPNFSFSGGLLWKARDDLWLAFAYHSPPGIVGGISLPGNATVTPSPATGSQVVHGDAQVNLSLPHILQVGGRWNMIPGRWELLGSVRWATLSSVDQFDLRLAGPELRDAEVREWVLRYHGLADAWQVETGVETPAGEATRWGARLRFDTGGVDSTHVAPEQISGPTFSLAGGVQFVLFGGFSLTLAAQAGFMVPRHVSESVFSPRAQTECVASGYDLDDCRGAREGSAIDTAAGDYQRYNFGAMLGISWDSL